MRTTYATIYVSFISLSNIFQSLQNLSFCGKVVALIKTLFEAKQVEKGEIVKRL